VLRSVIPSRNACGFLPKRSIVPHVQAHAGAAVAVLMDVQDFFGSVRPEQVRACLNTEKSPFQKREDWEAIVRLVTWADGEKAPGLPQGAPSSPIFANWVAFELDNMIQHLADKVFGKGVCTYTRYADDMVLSSVIPIPDFGSRATQVLQWCVRKMGWWINKEKTRVWSRDRGDLLQICGLNVPDAVGKAILLPRPMKRNLRVALYQIGKEINYLSDEKILAAR